MIHDVSIPAALIAGLISFLSPCVLPLVPPYLIYLTGATIEHVAHRETVSSSRRAVMVSAVMFVLGFSTVFVALGASASLIGGLIRAWSAELSIVAGIVIIVMGLHFLGLTRIGFLMREGRLPIPKPVGLWGAYLMGLAFAFGWTPCIGPILAATQARFRRPLTYPDTISIGARITDIGTDRFQIAHLIVSHEQGAVTTEGQGTIVTFHYVRGEKVPIPDELRRRIAELEGSAK